MAAVTIREATQDDIEAVVALADRGWRATYGEVLAPETIDEAMAEWYDPDGLRASLDREDTAFYVAPTDDADAAGDTGTVVGFLRGSLGDDVAHLGAIYVDPDLWGEGIGSQLLDRFEVFCADRGYETLEFSVLADNDVGQSFYRSRGYEAVEQREVDLFGQTVEDRVFRGSVA